MRVIDFFDRAALRSPERPCLIDGGTSWTYSQVKARSASLAAWLLAHEKNEKPRIGVLAPNSAEAIVAILAIFRCGAIWVPLSGRAPADEIADFIRLVECELILVHPSLSTLGREAAALAGCLTAPIDARLESEGEANFTSGYSSGDICSVFPTGGTTGAPKAAMWSHRTWSTLIVNFLNGIRHDGVPVHLAAAPLTHAAGVITMPLLAAGATNVIIERPDPELVMASIEAHRATTLFLPPTVIYTMLAHPHVRAYDYSSLQNLIYAAAPMSVEKLKEAATVFGPVLVQTFGQAEAPMVCTILTREDHVEALERGDDRRLASCGRPSFLTDLAILDDEGTRLPAGAVGEIAVGGDLLMDGYFGNPDATEACRVNGWQRTGDIGFLDEAGYLSITDRKRDMIITGGFNVFPSVVEQALWSHEAVQDCAVIGAPDPKWGEAVIAVVELKKGRDCDAEELLALCKERLGSIRAPKRIHFWPELPRSAVGKVLKREIRAHFWEGKSRSI